MQIKCVWTDGGREFVNDLWETYCTERGIRHETTPPHSSPANGVVERRNRTILNLAQSMLSDSRLPAHYWGEATSMAVHVLDLVPSSRHSARTPLRFGQVRSQMYHTYAPLGASHTPRFPERKGAASWTLGQSNVCWWGISGRVTTSC